MDIQQTRTCFWDSEYRDRSKITAHAVMQTPWGIRRHPDSVSWDPEATGVMWKGCWHMA